MSSHPRHSARLPIAEAFLSKGISRVHRSRFPAALRIAQKTPTTQLPPTLHTPASRRQRRFSTTAVTMGSNSYDAGWKKAAPYLPPDQATPDGEAFEKVIRGACHCGQVSYWLRKDRPLASKFCHCRDCQKMHGAPFQWAAIFHKEDVAFERGVDGLSFYKSSDKKAVHDLPCKVSCGHCGSRIMDEGRNMVLLFPGLLHFDEEKKRKHFNVQMHIFYSQRVVDLPDGRPKWAGLDEKSEEMEEEMEQEVDEVKEELNHGRKRSKCE